MAGSKAWRWLEDTLGALVGDADGSQLGTERHPRWLVARRRAGSETRWEHWSETRTDPSSALSLASKMAGSKASRRLGDTLGALVGVADGSQLGTALGIQDGR